MSINKYIIDLFAAIDAKDTERFASFLTENVIFSFGNFPPAEGKAAVKDVVSGFFSSISALKHNLENVWQTGDAAIIAGVVDYTRHSGSVLSVPFCDVLKMNDGKVSDYKIYIDISKLNSE